MYAASENGHHEVVQALLGAGANVNTPIMPSVRHHFMDGIDVCRAAYRSIQMQTPLWTACYEGHLDIVETLIQARANVNATNKVGSPLYLHAQQNAIIPNPI